MDCGRSMNLMQQHLILTRPYRKTVETANYIRREGVIPLTIHFRGPVGNRL